MGHNRPYSTRFANRLNVLGDGSLEIWTSGRTAAALLLGITRVDPYTWRKETMNRTNGGDELSQFGSDANTEEER